MDKRFNGWPSGFLGMLIFSGSLPATRVALTSFDPIFLTLARATIAGLIASFILLVSNKPYPPRRDYLSFLVVIFGVVVGYPLLSALALRHVGSAHAVVFLGLLPMLTALFGVLRNGERLRRGFWGFSLLGGLVVASFALTQGVKISVIDDLLMLAAVVVCALGYAEGARLSRNLGGWQVICWALALSLPLMLPLTLINLPSNPYQASWPALFCLAYVSLFSMLIGFFFWYRGLALGGIAAVSQLQLLLPFFGLGLSALLLGESINLIMLMSTLAVAVCVAGTRRFATPIERIRSCES